MLKRINSILLLSGFILFLSGCVASRVPVDYAYNPGKLKRVITGNWTEVKLNSRDITGNETALSGELIAIQSDTVYILNGLGLQGIHKSNINEAVVYMYKNQAGTFAIVTGLLYIPDIVASIVIGTPGFLFIGAPWLVIGSVLSIVEGSDHSNLLKYPYSNQLQELKKFARFPQGMPPGIDKSRLHLLTNR
jgi:hypothetical protein